MSHFTTDTEKAAVRAFAEPSAQSTNLPEVELQQPKTELVPVYAADPGDHEALLESFIEEQGEWEKYRPWDETTIANHESLALRIELVHEAGPHDHNWTVAAYESPVGERIWHATATANTPVEIVHTLLDALASDSGAAVNLDDSVSEQAIAHATAPLLGPLWRTDAGKVSQPLVGPVGPVLDLGDVVAKTEQRLADRVRQLRRHVVRPAQARNRRATAAVAPGQISFAGDGGHRKSRGLTESNPIRRCHSL
ncbi:DUF317 domain-containing protein [Streptomyces sp. NBC_00057]|uniref:DUF317 domain-containing protein n=1 Tax=Streptomyces sp. NBC_00057 TaxID=2975634 RepID=UPI003864E536